MGATRNFRRLIVLGFMAVIGAFTGRPAHADDASAIRGVMMWARSERAQLEEMVQPGTEMSFASRMSLFTGAATVLSFAELGDKSPLKAKIGDTAWKQLMDRLPLVQHGAASLAPGLVDDLKAEIEKPDLQTQFVLTTTSGGLLVPASDEQDLFKKGGFIYGSKSIASLVLAPAVFAKLAWLAVHPSTDPEVRQHAAALVTAGGVLKAQLLLAETRYRDEVGVGGAPTGYEDLAREIPTAD